ncbi:MAG: NTP transferase domain-containing protein, partial [Planctomycetota bacterium]
LACDLPRVRVETMLALVDHAVGSKADVCLAQTTDEANLDNSDESSRIHPLFGFYSVRCLGPARRALEAGRRRMIAFHDSEFSQAPFDEEVAQSAATGAETTPLSIVTFEVAAAETTNLNTPNDYERELSSAPAAARAHENGTS